MSFWINKQLIIITFLGIMVSQKGVNSSYLFDNEKPEQGKTQPYQKKANKSHAKTSGQKRLYAKRDSQQSIAEFFIRSKRPKTEDTTASNTSLSSSTNSSVDLTLDDFDKENNPSLAQESMSHAKATPEEITAFKKLFSNRSKIDYEAIKARKLAAVWLLTSNNNPMMEFASSETADGKRHRIVITTWSDGFITKYSAYVDGTPLGHWSTDQDSVKRAAINIIYNNK